MAIRLAAALPALVLMLVWAVPAQAHFLWLARGPASGGGEAIHVYFGELAEPDDPDLLDRVAGARVWQVRPDGTRRELKVEKQSESLVAALPRDAGGSLFVLDHEYGVIERGGETFLLRYYAKTGPEPGAEAWKKVDASKHLPLDLVAKADGKRLLVTVSWQGKPLSGAQVVALGPGIEDFEETTGEQGRVAIPLGRPGLYSIRARHIEQQAGESEGRRYGSTRHYSTLALPVSEVDAASSADSRGGRKAEAGAFPAIPQMVTSFGAAILDGALYTYGGHTGGAHAYSKESQADTLRRLSLKNPKAWESLGRGPGLQGLALVAHGGKLYRIGGFMAKNEEGEEHDLWSQADVASYDPARNAWVDLSPLPEPRSSFDAAVLDGKIYVVGGWWMAGDRETRWHDSAYVLDLNESAPRWQALPQPPFQRRALAVAAHEGKIYVIGGMQQQGGPTTRVDIYDPAGGKWSQGPSLQGEPMDGFGAAAFATGGRLFASTYSGKLQRLAADGKSWEVIDELERARFFHRMLPLSDTRLITVGGASMEVGKFEEIDVLDVSEAADASAAASAPQVLFQARQARATWENFPGFTADIRLNVDGDVRSGTLVVSSEGEVSLSGLELKPDSEIERSLRSLVSHRLGEAEFTEDVSFAKEDVEHPLGRLIKLDYDTRMASTYRVKGDLICQVNREMENGRFTISVLSVHRNREGKVLPESYNVCFWNEDGTLRESTTVRNEWTRVGDFDLPASHATVTAGKDSYTNVRIELSNHRLAKAE